MSFRYKISIYIFTKKAVNIVLNLLISKYLAKKLPRDSWINGIVSFRSIDSHERFIKVTQMLRKANCRQILDVGSGSSSPFKEMGFKVVSLDLKYRKGLDIVASATHLPFRSHMFDCVASLATIEHIRYDNRGKSLEEMKRCGKKVIIYTPLQDGKTFHGRVGDLAILNLCKKFASTIEQNTYEHVINGEPSPVFFEKRHFKLVEPDWNVNLWLSFMWITFVSFSLLSPIVTILYLLMLKRIKNPPYYGGYFIYPQNGLIAG